MTESFDPDKTIIKGGTGPARVSADATVIADATQLAGQDDTRSLPVGTRIGDYEIVKVIGADAAAIVYLAHDHSLGAQFVLKEYMPAALASRGRELSVEVRSERDADTFAAGLRSFIDEARLLAQLDHPALVKVHRFWETGGTAFMVMPYHDGPTLAQALKDMGSPPSEFWLAELLRPLLEAVQLLHQENCFHRAITPDNIVLTGDVQPVLLDCGGARQVIGDMTRNQAMLVKAGFAPIEQHPENRDLPQGPWTDIYAIGALAYLAILGQAPPPSTSRIMNDPVVPLVQAASGRYQAGFLHAIDRAMQVNPGLRPQSVEEFLGLLGWSDNDHISLEPEADFVAAAAPAALASKKKSPVKLIVGAVALVTVLLVAGTMWLTSPSQQAPVAVQTPSPPADTQPAAVAAPTAAPEVAAPAAVVSEPTVTAVPAPTTPAAGQVADTAAQPVSGSAAARGTQADSASQARTEPGATNAAPAKPAAAVAARPRPPEKRPPAPPPAAAKRPPAPVAPPVTAVVTPPPAPPPPAPAPVAAPAAPPPPPPPAQPVEPVKAPAVAAVSPVNSCKSAVFNWVCMKEMCGKPELRNHKECVQWRAPAD